MSWVDETLSGIENNSSMGKEDVKVSIRTAAHILLERGYDWDDIEIFMIAQLRPSVGEYIILLAKWIREVRNEEREVLSH